MDAEKLQLPITELSVRRPFKVGPDATARDAIKIMRARGGGSVLIVDEEEDLLGIFTERDALTKLFQQGNESLDQPIVNVMTPRPTTLHMDDSIVFALHHMHVGGYRYIPLFDEEDKLARIVSVRSMVDYLAQRLEAHELGESK